MILHTILLQIQDAIADTATLDKTAKHLDSLTSKVDSLSTMSPRQIVSNVSQFNWNGLIEKLSADLMSFGFRIIAAIVVFVLGRLIINKLHHVLRNILVRRDVDRSLSTFLLSLFKMTFLFILIITAIGIVGIETSSFIAVFASAGVALGMAMSGTLQNFAGGVLILLLKPYKVGDYIEFGGNKGFVKEIQIFHTIISTYNNETIIVPNGGLSTGTINNYTNQPYRRLEWRVSIAYGDDVSKARQVALAILKADDRVVKKYIDELDVPKVEVPEVQPLDESQARKLSWLQSLLHHRRVVQKKAAEWKAEQVQAQLKKMPRRNCAPSVGLESLADSAIVLVIRAWVRNQDYWPTFYDINERIYNEFPANGLHFPFPQLDVHLDDGGSQQ